MPTDPTTTAATCNAVRLPDVSPLREVVETIQSDDVIRVERLSCGHTKTTMTASQRPAQRRRCHRCADPLWQAR